MTREKLEQFKITKEFVQIKLKELNCNGLGEQDAQEFGEDFDEVMTLAEKALFKEFRESEWIPVSERLPEKSVWVLTYCKTKDGCEYQTVLLRSKYTGDWIDCDDFCDEVVAWMPLPEPYKEGE